MEPAIIVFLVGMSVIASIMIKFSFERIGLTPYSRIHGIRVPAACLPLEMETGIRPDDLSFRDPGGLWHYLPAVSHRP